MIGLVDRAGFRRTTEEKLRNLRIMLDVRVTSAWPSF
jgi:hypothetical protein